MFKNRFLKFLITVILVITCAFAAVACTGDNGGTGGTGDGGGNGGDNGGTGGGYTPPQVTPPSKVSYQGIHDLTAPNSSTDYLVQNGLTDYTIVTAKNLSTHLNVAKNEFTELFERATGAKVGVANDETVSTHTETGKYISIGENA